MRYWRRRGEIHGLRWRRWHHLQAVRQLLELGQTARVSRLVVRWGCARRRCVRVGHGCRLNVEIRGCGAWRMGTGATSSVLDHVGVLTGETHGLRHCHVIATLRDNRHVVRMRRVAGVRMRMAHSRYRHAC